MRFLLTVVSAAILIALVYLFVGWMVDGYFGGDIVPDSAVPDAWAAPDSWSEWRDITVVLIGGLAAFSILLLIILFIVLIVLAVTARRILRENVSPAIDSLKESLDNVKGTTEFAGETVAAPIIRVYSVVKGVRTGIGAVKAAPGFIRRRRGGS